MKATTAIDYRGVKITVTSYMYDGNTSAVMQIVKKLIRESFMRPDRTSVTHQSNSAYMSWWGITSTSGWDASINFSVNAHNETEARSRIRSAVSYLFRHQQPVKDIESGLSAVVRGIDAR